MSGKARGHQKKWKNAEKKHACYYENYCCNKNYGLAVILLVCHNS